MGKAQRRITFAFQPSLKNTTVQFNTPNPGRRGWISRFRFVNSGGVAEQAASPIIYLSYENKTQGSSLLYLPADPVYSVQRGMR
jgi:hypothetical protein